MGGKRRDGAVCMAVDRWSIFGTCYYCVSIRVKTLQLFNENITFQPLRQQVYSHMNGHSSWLSSKILR